MLFKVSSLLLLLPTIALAQDKSKVELTPESFTEVVQTAAQISGAHLVGLARFGAMPRKMAQIQVAAYVPAAWAGSQTCLSVMSIDGFYQSIGTYSVADNWDGGEVVLAYPTETPNRIKEYKKGEVAPLFSKGACGEELSESSTVFWGENLDQKQALLLNTSRSDETYVFFPDFPDLDDVECERSKLDNRTAFDTLCFLPEAVSDRSQLTVGTVSFKNGEMGREVMFEIFPAKG